MPNYRAEVPVYLAMPELANQVGFAMIDNYDARMGGDRVDAPPPLPTTKRDVAEEQVRSTLMWGRILGGTGEQKPYGDISVSPSNGFLNGKGPIYNYGFGGLQAGMDVYRHAGAGGDRDFAGLYVGYIGAFANVQTVYPNASTASPNGKVLIDAYSIGAYWTRLWGRGGYIDAVVQGTILGDVHGSTVNTGMTVEGKGFAASLEGGAPIYRSGPWSFEPQAQLIYQLVSIESGTDAFGQTSFPTTGDFRGRIGTKLLYQIPTVAGGPPTALWGRFNLWHDFIASAPAATFSTLTGADPTTVSGTLGGTWAQVDVGGEAALTPTASAFGSVYYDRALDSASQSWSVGGRLGVKVAF